MTRSSPPTEPAARTRIRRSREEVAERIRTAAREIFTERGYAGATTKEIAQRAQASETLLFRYYGSKAALFDAVISTPFDELMRDFLAGHAGPSVGATRLEDSRAFVEAVYPLLERNRDMLGIVVAAGVGQAEGQPSGLTGLHDYFARSVERLDEQYRAEAGSPDLDPGIAVRLGFGMVAAAVLLRDWLFAGDIPAESVMTSALTRMLDKALAPVSSD